MFSYFAIRSQSNSSFLQSFPIVTKLQDCLLFCKMENNSVLNFSDMLQDPHAIAMGFSGCNDILSCTRYWHTNTDSQSYEWISLSYEKSRKSIQSVRVPPITIAMGLQKTGNPLAIGRNAGRIRSQWDWCNPGSIRPTLVQSRGNGAVQVWSAIKPNLTTGGQVWALTRGQAQRRAWGYFAILSVPRNPQN